MKEIVVELKDATVRVHNGLSDPKVILDHVNLTIYEHDFITVLGGNGAGKSTLFNVIAGTLALTSGRILIKGEDVTSLSAQQRAKYLARVFQDPKMGTAPRMTVLENLHIASQRGAKRRLIRRSLGQHHTQYQQLLAKTGNGLEHHLETATGLLSGGQRQALSLLMATLKRPQLLLLDEHTAALDPKTSRSLMQLTEDFVQKDQLTALMITHHLEDALAYGNRVLVMRNGQIVQDLYQSEKAELHLQDYFQFFE
ncbi:ABC transporter ATP-binding protein [Streptococcus halichoeri]|uniref:ABC transporter ATP-binding protein n=1 Tax=Streptococcus halichoeri TaxID=254785 RepID=UPI00135B2B86|nr:ATP-binding cassette domain-containing protein [Streptococcus halichoeri]